MSDYIELSPNNSNTTTGDINWNVFPLCIFILLGVFGNSLVCVAIFTERRLQNVTNYFLFSLAVADLLVSVLVMPFSILVEFDEGKWRLGFMMCAVHCYSDVFLCTLSIVHMTCISLDRYLGISKPLRTRHKPKLFVPLKILVVWLISILVSCPLAVLASVKPGDVYDNEECGIFNRYFMIYGSTLSFIIPCSIMFVTYVKTTQLLKKQALLCVSSSDGFRRFKRAKKPSTGNQRRQSSMVTTETEESNVLHDNYSNPTNHSPTMWDKQRALTPYATCHRKSSNLSDISRECAIQKRSSNVSDISRENPIQKRSINVSDISKENAIQKRSTGSLDSSLKVATQKVSRVSLDVSTGSSEGGHRTMREKLKEKTGVLLNKGRTSTIAAELANEQKATRVLGLVFACFVICWTPFFALNFTKAFCGPICPPAPRQVESMFLWLGYLSSTINPMIYTTFNKKFRKAFADILKCRCGMERRTNSERLRNTSVSYNNNFSTTNGNVSCSIVINNCNYRGSTSGSCRGNSLIANGDNYVDD